MRTRYYNPEVKRFINQDTVLGSITNSQSLNRYAYVQGNPISLIDPFGMSPSDGKNAVGHTLLDFMGLIPGIGFVFDAANSAWYVSEGNYTMAALSAFSAIPGLGDAVSAGMLATKGAKAAELCKIIKKLGCVAKVAENAGEMAINANNAFTDIKEGTVGIGTVASLLAAGLNGFGIYASIKRYRSVSVDTGKVTEGVEGGNKVSENYSGKSSSNISQLLADRPELSGTNREKLLSMVQNNKLATYINEVYRPGASIGDGGTADALISEFYEGNSRHLIKAKGRLNEINKMINSGTLGLNDLDIAEALRDDLEYAIKLFE